MECFQRFVFKRVDFLREQRGGGAVEFVEEVGEAGDDEAEGVVCCKQNPQAVFQRLAGVGGEGGGEAGGGVVELLVPGVRLALELIALCSGGGGGGLWWGGRSGGFASLGAGREAPPDVPLDSGARGDCLGCASDEPEGRDVGFAGGVCSRAYRERGAE